MSSRWAERAACLTEDPRLFNSRDEREPEADLMRRVIKAFQICDGCPVVNECLASAKQTRDMGVRGGWYRDGKRSLSSPCGTRLARKRHAVKGEPCPTGLCNREPAQRAAHTPEEWRVLLNEARRLRQQGLSYSRIAYRLGVGVDALRQARRKYWPAA